MCLAIHSDAQSKCVSVYINFSNWQSILLSLYVRTWWIDETQWNSIQVKICQSLIVMTYQSVSELLSKNAINLTNFNFKCSSLWTQLCKNLLVKKQSANLRSLRGQMFYFRVMYNYNNKEIYRPAHYVLQKLIQKGDVIFVRWLCSHAPLMPTVRYLTDREFHDLLTATTKRAFLYIQIWA